MNLAHRRPLSVVVAIAAHYQPNRIGFLVHVIQAILGWRVDAITIRIATNDSRIAEEPPIAALLHEAAKTNVTIIVDVAAELKHPFLLTWSHKKHLTEWAREGGPDDDLFVYIEDDIVISNDNLDYFVQYLHGAKAAGFIPGFVRYEISPGGDRVSVDFSLPQLHDPSDFIEIADTTFVNPRYPYWAGFIVDRGLADEYLNSNSFDLDKSKYIPQVSAATVRVRSAMGLCFEKLPNGFSSRYVLPTRDGQIDHRCLVWHCAQNYSALSKENFARIPIDRLLVKGGTGVAYWLLNWTRLHWDRWAGRLDRLKRKDRLPGQPYA